MRQSNLPIKTRKEAPKDEVSKNAQLLIRAGFIHKELAGVYSILPLGLRVIQKIENIIREEMNALGGIELLMSSLQDPSLWEKTDRFFDESMDVWFKTHLHSGEKFHEGTELGLANTHEEPITNMLREHVSSYKDLPFSVYQIQTKFRNEVRAKSGMLRGREFAMKDLYSFSRNEEEFRGFYEKCAVAYEKIFARVGIGEQTFRTFASGGAFSEFSDEFQTITDAGEDTIYIDDEKGFAVNKEVYTDETLEKLGLNKNDLREARAIEVGNIFPLGTRFSSALGLSYKNEEGKEVNPVMGSYGIGIGRLMGAVVEVLADDKGLVWPESITPFDVHLVHVGSDEDVVEATEVLYTKLTENNISVLFDDRDKSPGEKFADSDLLGIPRRITVGPKTLKEGMAEMTHRESGETTLRKIEEIEKI